MKMLKFIGSILKDLICTIGGGLLMILVALLLLAIVTLMLIIFILLPSYVVAKVFHNDIATILTLPIGFIAMICVLDGKNPFKLIAKDIKSSKDYIVNKWNQA